MCQMQIGKMAKDLTINAFTSIRLINYNRLQIAVLTVTERRLPKATSVLFVSELAVSASCVSLQLKPYDEVEVHI